MKRIFINSLETFGMLNLENLHWLTKLTDPDIETSISGLEINTTARPFMYAIPLRGLSHIQKLLFLNSDTFISSGNNDDTFKPILEGAESVKGVDAWNEENPRIFGIVLAEDFIKPHLPSHSSAT